MVYMRHSPHECARRLVNGVARCYADGSRDEIHWAARSIARSGCSADEALRIIAQYLGPRPEELARRVRDSMKE